MPNVAGREFPYTPQGMAAAEQYKQSLGMRGGGMMGFRPVGYAEGDLVEDTGNLGRLYGDPRLSNQDVQALIDQADQRGNAAGFAGLPEDVGNLGRTAASDVAPDVWAIYQGLVNVIQSGSKKDIAAYVEANRQDLNDMVSMRMLPQDQANFITNTLLSFAPLSEPVLAPDSEPSWIGPKPRPPVPEPSWIGPKPPRPFDLGDSIPPDILSGIGAGAGLGTAAPVMGEPLPDELVPPGIRDEVERMFKPPPPQTNTEVENYFESDVGRGMRHGGIMSLRRR